MINSIRQKIFALSILFSFFLFSQEQSKIKNVNILQSKKLEKIKINDSVFQKFSGEVLIEFKDFLIKCDTLIMDEEMEIISGYKEVEIFNDSIFCQTDSVSIYQNKDIINFFKNSTVKKNETSIHSNFIKYDFNSETIEYLNFGKVFHSNQIITSNKFLYDIENDRSLFVNEVNFDSDEYALTTDTLEIHNEILFFSGHSKINNDDFTLETTNGEITDAKNFSINAPLKLVNDSTIVYSDKMIKIDSLNLFEENIKIKKNNKYIFGEKLIQKDNTSIVTNNSFFMFDNNTDSVFIYGDSIIIKEDPSTVNIINNILINGEETNGSCDSIFISSEFTKFEMLGNPILWFDKNQITGKKIDLFNKDDKVDSIFIQTEPFITSKIDSTDYYNQIKGNILQGKFKNGKINLLEFSGNCQMKFIDVEDDVIGINDVKSGTINIVYNNNKLSEVNCSYEIDSKYSEYNINDIDINNKNPLNMEGFKLNNTIFYDESAP